MHVLTLGLLAKAALGPAAHRRRARIVPAQRCAENCHAHLQAANVHPRGGAGHPVDGATTFNASPSVAAESGTDRESKAAGEPFKVLAPQT